jgi:phosphoglycerate dehydrogenase-like enzyme
MVEGQWRKGDKDAKSTPLRDRTIGLLGYGAINTKVHRFLSGFDVQFSILRRSWKNQDHELPTKVNRYEPHELHQFLEEVDTLIVAVPQTDDTINMLGFEEITLLGNDGVLVNVGRGKVINEESLYRALAEGLIAGAAIDVWYEYKPEPDESGLLYPFHYPFHKLGNVVLSPHRAMSPFDDLKRWDEVIENIHRFAEGRRDLLNIVNLVRGY